MILTSVEDVLLKDNFTVIGNKSRFVSGEASWAVSLCHSSEPDLAVFNPIKSAMVYISENIEMSKDSGCSGG